MSSKVILLLSIISVLTALIIWYFIDIKNTYFQKIKNQLNETPLLKKGIHLVLFNIIFFIVASFYLIKFETNDDVFMLLIASGKYSGTPSAFLPYMNYFYGSILASCYTYFPKIEWYTLSLSFVHIVSISIITFYIFMLKYRRLYRLILVILVFLVELYLIAHFQFTTTSMLGCIAGLILINKGGKLLKFFGFLLFILGFFIRDFSSAIVLFSFIPLMFEDFRIFIKNLVKMKFSVPIKIRYIFLIVLTIFCFKSLDTFVYNQHKEMKDYREIDLMRALTTDPMPTKKMKEFCGDSIVSKTDMGLIQSFYFDTKKYDVKFYKYIYQNYTKPNFNDRINNVLMTITKTIYVIFSFILLLIFLYIISNNENEKTVYLVSFFTFIVSFLTLSFLTDFSYKGRVIITLFFPLMIVLINRLPILSKNSFIVFIAILTNVILSFMDINTLEFIYINMFFGFFYLFNILTNYFKLFALYISIVFFMFFSFIFFDDWKWKRGDNETRLLEYQTSVNDYFRNNESEKIVYFPAQYNYELINPYNISNSPHIDKVILNSWLANLPYNKREFASFDVFIKKGTPILLNKANREKIGMIIEVINSKKEIKIESLHSSKKYEVIRLIETNKFKQVN